MHVFWTRCGTSCISEQTPQYILPLCHLFISWREKILLYSLQNSIVFFYFFSLTNHFELDLEHTRVTVSHIQVLPQLSCREMLPPSCLRKTGLCPRPAVCHQCWASSEAGTLSPGSRGTLFRAFKNYSKSSNSLSKQRQLCKGREKTQETDE